MIITQMPLMLNQNLQASITGTCFKSKRNGRKTKNKKTNDKLLFGPNFQPDENKILLQNKSISYEY